MHDGAAIAVYRAFTLRIDLAWLSVGQWVGLARRRLHWATVVGTGAHIAGAGWIESQRRRSRWRRRVFWVFSVQQPLAELVAALNAFDPGILTAYPSALALLAEEQAAGRLHLRPVIVESGGESMGQEDRARIAAALGGALHDVYGCSAFDPLAFDCAQGWLHMNNDWAILEPVDADFRPTPTGEPSHTVLLTKATRISGAAPRKFARCTRCKDQRGRADGVDLPTASNGILVLPKRLTHPPKGGQSRRTGMGLARDSRHENPWSGGAKTARAPTLVGPSGGALVVSHAL